MGTSYSPGVNSGTCVRYITGLAADGVTDDRAALQAAVDAYASAGDEFDGANLFLPPGVFLLSNTLNIPHGVRLHGAGRRATTLKAASGFPSTNVVTLGEESTAVAFRCGLDDLTVDANGANVGVFSQRINEMSGLDGVLVRGFVVAGIDIDTPGSGGIAQQYDLTDLEVYAHSTSATSSTVGLDLSARPRTVDRVTVSASSGASNIGVGVRCNGFNASTLSQIHVERCNVGIDIGPTTACNSTIVIGPNGDAATTTLLRIGSGCSATTAFALRSLGTNCIIDNRLTQTITEQLVGFYLSGGGTSANAPYIIGVNGKTSRLVNLTVLGDQYVGASGPSISSGSSSPEGSKAAVVGSIYLRTGGGAATSFYVKESGGAGNTGWVAK